MQASKLYVYYGKEFSKAPIAICASSSTCYRREGKYCYCKLGCTAKRELDGSGKMLKSENNLFNKLISNST